MDQKKFFNINKTYFVDHNSLFIDYKGNIFDKKSVYIQSIFFPLLN